MVGGRGGHQSISYAHIPDTFTSLNAHPPHSNETGKYGVYPSEAAWQRMRTFATRINPLTGSPKTCAAPTNAPVGPSPPCANGKEGPTCDVDVNECARGTDVCPVNAACVDNVGGYNCTCFPGYVKKGGACERDADAIQVRGWVGGEGGCCDMGKECVMKRCPHKHHHPQQTPPPPPRLPLQGTFTSQARSTARVALSSPGPPLLVALPTTPLV